MIRMKSKASVIKFGGISLILAGILFFVQYLFMLPLPSPPLTDTGLMFWLQEWRFNISMADEVLIFAALLLIPSAVALYRVLVKVSPIQTMLGCGLLAVNIPVYLFLVIILGRWVYPVYEIELSPDLYRLVISLYYGGMHCTALILGAATILLSLVTRKSGLGRFTAYLGLTAGIFDFIGSFPWLIGTAVMFTSQLLSAAWFVLLGVQLLGKTQLDD
ncbi:hypothetical protein [Paenibacillus sp. MMS20-IR301]|uniref:hypothetical protein n=1 Tax=Paenibacillus sp. MMS20-IR301 TaxID=2895946 RepID=UPI0028F07957|nr:hypothetical protein [Paenibacillus sp. MMS20-IR301]WNS41475.1 hypothetical protein LOS79_20940 [Paenibacillus sp. MMS20-IR301]